MWAMLAPYAARIAATLALILAIVSGYFYWKHEVQAEQHKEDMVELAKRNAKEKEDSDREYNEALSKVVSARQDDQSNYERTLKAYASIINDRRSVTVVGMRDKSRVAATKSDSCPAAGQTDVSEGSARENGRISEEIPELAALCLLAADEIRRTHRIK